MNSKQETFPPLDQNTIVPAIPMEFNSQERIKEAGKFCPHAGVVSRASGMFQEQGRVLLLNRLRMASLILALATAAFLIRGIVLKEYLEVHGQEMLILESILTGILLAVSGLLWIKPCLCLWRLRICEAITFGAPALFFIWFQFSELCACDPVLIGKVAYAFPLKTVIPWMVLIYTYGFFIPNSLRGVTTVVSLVESRP
ncbi:hypothetical protein [Gimesia aquarii]|uniref:Uncharacterized protein n=1 Tax=Gimesia aquarii TaxID=2527964 RepID=A0A517VVD9_9PLAN|nr:hypothetical protein [Gimesia aquarii]QDT96967.1 hypothetical protein V144x_24380 [Gimesia aquarii]